MRFVSLDTSTNKSGIAFYLDGELADYELVDCSKNKDINARMDEMGTNLIARLSLYSPTLVYIEQPKGGGQNIEMVRKLSEILGVVRGWCLQNDCEYHEIMPSEWRKYCGIEQGKKKREELKAESMAYVFKNFGCEVNDDVADAICLGAGVLKHFG